MREKTDTVVAERRATGFPGRVERTPPVGRCALYSLFARDCSKDTGFIQPVPDGVMRAFVDGLRLGLRATYPVQGAHGSALACARDRRCVASYDSAGCRVPPH